MKQRIKRDLGTGKGPLSLGANDDPLNSYTASLGLDLRGEHTVTGHQKLWRKILSALIVQDSYILLYSTIQSILAVIYGTENPLMQASTVVDLPSSTLQVHEAWGTQ